MNPLVEALLRRKAQQLPTADPLQAGTTAQAPSPFALDPNLEAQAAPMMTPVNPMVMAIAQHLGLMNMMKNKQNEKAAALQEINGQY